MQVDSSTNGYTITLDEAFLGETVWTLDGYLTNLRGTALKDAARDLGIRVKSSSKVADIRHDMRNILISRADQSGMDVLADLLSLGGVTPAKLVTQQDMRDQVTRYLQESGIETTYVSIIVDDIQAKFGTVDIDLIPAEQFTDVIDFHMSTIEEGPTEAEVQATAEFRATPTGDLYYRALSIGYDTEAAARLADCWVNYDMISDPCVLHPGHSVSRDHQGFAVNVCQACAVIGLSERQGFVSTTPTTCRVCLTVRASVDLGVGPKFLGSGGVPDQPGILVCDGCHGRVLDTRDADSDHTIIGIVWPFGNNTNFAMVVVLDPGHDYPDANLVEDTAILANLVSPGMYIPRSTHLVYDPAKREAYDVSLDRSGRSEVRELAPGEAASLAWEYFGQPNIRIAPRLHVTLVETPGRYAVAESAEVFDVSGHPDHGRLHNPSFRHRIVKYSGDNCCSVKDRPGHLHMSAMPTVISPVPDAPVVRVECRLGDVFVVDRITYTLLNLRHGDPLLIPA